MTPARVLARSPQQLDDTRLMRRVQAGDGKAFGEFYSRFGARAHHLARAIAGDAQADDVVQEAFTSVWRTSAGFRPELGTVLDWVMGTVRHRAIDSLRSHARHDRRRADAQGVEDRLLAPGDVESESGERDQAARLRKTLAALPGDQRDVIALAYFGQLSASEIADELSLPLGTVKGRLRLGLEKLRVPIEDERSKQ